MRSILPFSAIFISLVSIAVAQVDGDYAWPLKIRPELTSKFCDYRAGHFHGGLDIRTQGRTGFRVYAVGDGFISRVTTSFRGYGKALYLKLRDGRTIVYGHLSRFSDQVEDLVRMAQLKERKYAQDIYFGPHDFPLKKGTLVAFSGESGSGAPHLHFEVRSPLNNPLNPLRAGFAIPDKSPPVFYALAVRQYCHDCDPDYSLAYPCDIEFIPVSSTAAPNRYFIADTISDDGLIALAVSGGDRIGRRGFLYGFFGLRLYIDDSLAFETESDSLSFNTTGQLNYVRDLESKRLYGANRGADNDAGVFYRLSMPPGARQYFWQDQPFGAGIIRPSGHQGGLREIKIVASDEAGNESSLVFHIREPELAAAWRDTISYRRVGNNIIAGFVSAYKPSYVELEGRNSKADKFRILKSQLHSEMRHRDGDSSYASSFAVLSSPGEMEYRFRCRNADGGVSPWIYFHESHSQARLQIQGFPDLVRIEFYSGTDIDRPVTTLVNQGRDNVAPMFSCGPGCYLAEIRGEAISGLVNCVIRDASGVLLDTSFVLYAVGQGSPSLAYSPDSTLMMAFQRNSSFYPAFVFPTNGTETSIMSRSATVFDIQPDIFIADAPVKFSFKVPALGLAGKRIGVYGYSYTGDDWSYIAGIDGSSLEASGMGLGKLALIEDDEPPVIRFISPSGVVKSRKPLLTCAMSDKISGLELDSGLAMSIDGIWVPAEFDIDTGRFAYRVRSPLGYGKHKLEISASDNQGNSSTRTVYFKVSAASEGR